MLPFASAAFASRWDEAKFPEWDQKFIDRMVSDSPWARPWKGTAVLPVPDKRMVSSFAQIGIPGVGWPRGPRTGGPAATQDTTIPVLRVGVDLIVRWATALPVRRALALQEFGRDGLANTRAIQMLTEEPDEIVLDLAGIPHALVGQELERNLAKAKLTASNRRPLNPLSVEVPTMGAQVTAKLRFVRFENLDPEGTIEIVIPGALPISERFKLRSMVYEGRIAL
jgi:hypothetical protein